MGVFLSRLQAFVAQHLLDGSQVRAAVEQVGGKGVAQDMGADSGVQPAVSQAEFEPFLDPPLAQTVAPVVQEQG